MPIRNQFFRNAVSVRKRLEVDFVCNREDKRYYIQSAFAIPDSEKMEQEQKPLIPIWDSFKKSLLSKIESSVGITKTAFLLWGLRTSS